MSGDGKGEDAKAISFDSEFTSLIKLCKEIFKARFAKEKESFYARNQEWNCLINFEKEYDKAENPSKFYQCFTEWAEKQGLNNKKVFESDEWVEHPESIIYMITKRIELRSKLPKEQAKALRDAYHINLSRFYEYACFFNPTLNLGTGSLESRRQSEFSDRFRLQLLRVMLIVCTSDQRQHYITEINGIYADIGEASPFEKKSVDVDGVLGTLIKTVGETVPDMKPFLDQVDSKTVTETIMGLVKSDEAKETMANAITSFRENKIQNLAMGVLQNAANPNATGPAVSSEEATNEVIRIANPMLRKLGIIPKENTSESKEEDRSLQDLESQLE